MLRRGFLSLSVLLCASLAVAEVIQVPENCIQTETAPCLVRSVKQETLLSKNQDYSYLIDENSITKWTSFGEEIDVEVVAGTLFVKKAESNQKLFKLNGIKLSANSFFAVREKQQLKILDGEKFVMSEYQLSSNAEVGTVLVKVDFLEKQSLIKYLAQFFKTKSQLVQYLKKTQSKWSIEFAQQNKNQTKVLKRSIASVEDEERQNLQRKLQAEKELKRVRQEFFYRTFYR